MELAAAGMYIFTSIDDVRDAERHEHCLMESHLSSKLFAGG